MWNARLDEAQAGIEVVRRNINNPRYTDDTTLMAESEEELKSFLLKVKEETEKLGLKLSIQKTKIMASSPITSWQIDGETMKTVRDFVLGGSKIIADGDCSHEIKRHLLLVRKAMTNLGSILKKQRHYFANKGPSSQTCGFPSTHVWVWELDYKESWVPKNWCFWAVVLEKTLWESLRLQGDQTSHPKGNHIWCSIFIVRTDAEAETLILWPPDVKNSLEETLMLEKFEGRRRRGWTENEMVGWHHQLSGHEFEQAPKVGDGQGSLACCSPWGCKESDTAEQLNWTEWLNWHFYVDSSQLYNNVTKKSSPLKVFYPLNMSFMKPGPGSFWSATLFPGSNMMLLQEGGPLPCPESGLLSNTRKWIVWGDTRAETARDFIGKEPLGGEQEGKGTQEDYSAVWLEVSGFMVMGLVSGLFLASYSDSGSFRWYVHCLAKMDASKEDSGRPVGHIVCFSDLSWNLPVGGDLLVPCSLSGPPVIK